MEERDDDLDRSEKEALRRLGEAWNPPDGLRGRTLEALRDRGLLRTPSIRKHRILWPVSWAAAIAMAFAFGLYVGKGGAMKDAKPEPRAADRQAPAVASQAGQRYVLLLFESEAYRPAATPEGQRDRVREYGRWARETAHDGRFVDGEKLADDGRWCRVRGGQVEVMPLVVDRELGTLAGYFVVGAASYEEAVEVATGCPHLRYGGTIEVRRIEST